MVILDPITNKEYTDEEARQQPKEVRSRLLNHCKEQGYNVLTIEECNEILKKR